MVKKIPSNRLCLLCNSKRTYTRITKEGWICPCWHKYRDGHICDRCYSRIVKQPKRFHFKNKHAYGIVRTGICSLCGKKGKTHIHHIEYHDDDPKKDTIEVCPACHFKESVRLGQRDHIREARRKDRDWSCFGCGTIETRYWCYNDPTKHILCRQCNRHILKQESKTYQNNPR